MHMIHIVTCNNSRKRATITRREYSFRRVVHSSETTEGTVQKTRKTSLHAETQFPLLVLLRTLLPFVTFQQRLYHLEQFAEFKGFAQANQRAPVSICSLPYLGSMSLYRRSQFHIEGRPCESTPISRRSNVNVLENNSSISCGVQPSGPLPPGCGRWV